MSELRESMSVRLQVALSQRDQDLIDWVEAMRDEGHSTSGLIRRLLRREYEHDMKESERKAREYHAVTHTSN